METSNSIKKTFTEGKGSDELKMMVRVTSEEEKMMEQIKMHSPVDWNGKDLQLLMEARRIIKEGEQNEESSENKENPQNRKTIKKTESNKSGIIWLSLGIAGLIFLIVLVLIGKQRIKDVEREIVTTPYARSLVTKTINHGGVEFSYPNNWIINFQDFVENSSCFVGGVNENAFEFGVILRKESSTGIEETINEIIYGYAASEMFQDFSSNSIYRAKLGRRDALCVDYSYKYEGKSHFAKVYGFEKNGAIVIVNSIANNEKELEGEDFQMMENSLKIFGSNY